MSNPLRIRRRTSGAAGAPSSLLNAELAFNEVDNTLYYGYGDVAGSASSILAIGGPGAFATLTSCQTISGDKTFTGSLNAITQANATNSNLVATTAFVTNKLSSLTNVVNMFNNRTGNVTLTSNDVTTALGYSPLTPLANITHANGTIIYLTHRIRGEVQVYTEGLFTKKQYSGFYSTANGAEPTSYRVGLACLTTSTGGLTNEYSLDISGDAGIYLSGSDQETQASAALLVKLDRVTLDFTPGADYGFQRGSLDIYGAAGDSLLTGNSTYTELSTVVDGVPAGIQLSNNGTHALALLKVPTSCLTLLYEANSILTQGYADVRYMQLAANGSIANLTVTNNLTATNNLTVGGNLTVTGNATAVTQSNSDNSNLVATTAFVTNKLANLPVTVASFNSRTGNVTLTANDVTSLVDANYIQVWKDTQTTAAELLQFPKYSALTSSTGPIRGYSRGMLTSNTSGTITKTIFDGSLLASSSASAALQYKAIGFNSNDTGAANSSKTGRLMLGQYGEIFLDSVTKTNANTITSAALELTGGSRPQGTTQIYDPHLPSGMRGKYTVGAAGSYNPSSFDEIAETGYFRSAEFTLNQLSATAVTYSNSTTIGRPSQFQLVARSSWDATDSNLAFSHAYDYRTTIALGESAELIFQNHNRTALRTPNMTDFSILTKGYADGQYVPSNTADAGVTIAVDITGAEAANLTITSEALAYTKSSSSLTFNPSVGLTYTRTEGLVSPTNAGDFIYKSYADTTYVRYTGADPVSIKSIESEDQAELYLSKEGQVACLSTATAATAVALSVSANGTATLTGVTTWSDDSILTQGYADARYAPATTNLQFLRGTAVEVDATVPLIGEPVYVTDLYELRIGDGTTSGGRPALTVIDGGTANG